MHFKTIEKNPALYQEMNPNQRIHPLFATTTALLFTLLWLVMGLMTETKSVLAAGTVRYVSLGGTDSGNCSVDYCATIAYAHSQAQVGDEIKVAQGTYKEAEIAITKRITLSGGFDPSSDPTWAKSTFTQTPTILDGNALHRVMNINGAIGAAIQYLTIQNGNADFSPLQTTKGGGILIVNSDEITMIHLNVVENVASSSSDISMGGGIAIIGTGDFEIIRSILRVNSTTGSGGGLATNTSSGPINIEMESSLIAQNSADAGGAIATSGLHGTGILFKYVTIADNDLGTALDTIWASGASAAFNASATLLSGNQIGLRATTTAMTSFQGTPIFDDNVSTPLQGNILDVNNFFRMPVEFHDPATANYRLAKGSPLIDLINTAIKTDLDGNLWKLQDDCTPRSLCPFGRYADYGAYEYVVGSEPSIRYVALEGDNNSPWLNNCLDSAYPCETMQHAQNFALGGDEIRIAQGTYISLFSPTFSFVKITQGITLTGGYTLSNWTTLPANVDPSLTVLDGTNDHRVVELAFDGSGAVVQNLTIRNGYGQAKAGAGISVVNSDSNVINAEMKDVTLRNCIVENNHTGNSAGGGGFITFDPTNLVIEDCTFRDNSAATGPGGGLAIWNTAGDAEYTLRNLQIYNNHAYRNGPPGAFYGGMGGGLYLEGKALLELSELYENSAALTGGGIAVGDNANPTIDRVIIRDNEAGFGGGLSLYVTGGATIQNSLFARNAASSTVALEGIPGYEALFGGNAIYASYMGVAERPLRLLNLTLADNKGAVPEAMRIDGSTTMRTNQLINLLISGSEVGLRSDGEGQAELQKVLIASDVPTQRAGFGLGDLMGEILTGSAGYLGANDFRLQPSSPAVDAGELMLDLDFALGNTPRTLGSATDIGAYETTKQKQSQSIAFGPLANRALTDQSFDLQATASSGLPVSFVSLTTTVCTVNGNSVTLIAAGTCTVQASQAGNETFNPAANTTQSFEVGVVVPQEILNLPMVTKE